MAGRPSRAPRGRPTPGREVAPAGRSVAVGRARRRGRPRGPSGSPNRKVPRGRRGRRRRPAPERAVAGLRAPSMFRAWTDSSKLCRERRSDTERRSRKVVGLAETAGRSCSPRPERRLGGRDSHQTGHGRRVIRRRTSAAGRRDRSRSAMSRPACRQQNASNASPAACSAGTGTASSVVCPVVIVSVGAAFSDSGSGRTGRRFLIAVDSEQPSANLIARLNSHSAKEVVISHFWGYAT